MQKEMEVGHEASVKFLIMTEVITVVGPSELRLWRLLGMMVGMVVSVMVSTLVTLTMFEGFHAPFAWQCSHVMFP